MLSGEKDEKCPRILTPGRDGRLLKLIKSTVSLLGGIQWPAGWVQTAGSGSCSSWDHLSALVHINCRPDSGICLDLGSSDERVSLKPLLTLHVVCPRWSGLPGHCPQVSAVCRTENLSLSGASAAPAMPTLFSSELFFPPSKNALSLLLYKNQMENQLGFRPIESGEASIASPPTSVCT